MRQFALDYIKNSKNVENKRSAEEITRVSIERLCAGPAVPLIYEYLKLQHPNLKRVLEEKKSPDELQSGDIIKCGMDTQDELCMLVV